MQKAQKITIAAVVMLAGCPADPIGNPSKVWLNDNGSELAVKLQDTEPKPY